MPLLIVTVDSPAAQAQAQALANALRQHGSVVAAVVPCHNLVREAVRLAPQAVVALDPGDGPALLDALRLLAGSVQVQRVQQRWAVARVERNDRLRC